MRRPDPRPQARDYDCPRYGACLRFAANREWDSFHCGECPLSGRTTPGDPPGPSVLVGIDCGMMSRLRNRAGASGHTIEAEILSLVIAGMEEI